MSTSTLPRRPHIAGAGAAAATLLVGVGVLSWWTGQTAADGWLPAVYLPVILLVTLPLLHRVAAREDDRVLFWILAAGLVVKLAGAVARYYFAFDVYGGNADAGTYHQWGVTLSENFRSLNFETGLHSYTDTDFIRLVTGVIYTFTGASLLGGFFIFAWLSFVGQLLFYRAFTIAVPDGRHHVYAWLVFFLPTMLFWPSSIGKEAWMVLTLGMAAYGAARILSGQPGSAMIVATLGLAGAAAVRPHIGGLMTAALIVAYVIRRRRGEQRHPVARAMVVLATVVMMLFSVSAAQDLLGAEDVSAALENTAEKTSGGGSSFEPVLVRTPLDFPIAAVTVLFRPHLLEVDNAQIALSALEGMLLALLVALSLRRMWWALPQLRSRPYVVLALVFTGVFILAYSSIANFGILARQRAQLFPLFAVLLALPQRQPRPAPVRTPR